MGSGASDHPVTNDGDSFSRQQFTLAINRMRHESARRSDDPPPRQTFDPAQKRPNRSGRPGMARLGRDLSVGQDVTGLRCQQHRDAVQFERAQTGRVDP